MSRISTRMLLRAVWLGWSLLAVVWLLPARADAAWQRARPQTGAVTSRVLAETRESIFWVLAPGDTLTYLVTGEGRLRVKCRPEFPDASSREEFRYGVVLDGRRTRLFKRRSAPDEAASVLEIGDRALSGEEVSLPRLGEVDNNDLEVPAETGRIQIVNREETSRRLFVRVLLSDGLSSARPQRSRAAHRFGGEVKAVGLGLDTNPYLEPETGDAPVDKLYLPLDVELEYTGRLGPGFRIGADYTFAGSFYDDPILDQLRHAFVLGQQFTGGQGGSRSRWTVNLDQRLVIRNKTYFGRGEEEAFESSLDSTTISLGDRFNYAELRFRGRVGYRPTERVLIEGLGYYLDRDYSEDFAQHPDIYALDYERMRLQLAAEFRFGGGWRADLAVRQDHKRYAEKYSRDEAGVVVASDASQLRRSLGTLAVRRLPRSGLRYGLTCALFQSEDRYQGYWDYSGTGWTLDLGWRWAAGHLLQATWDYQLTDYDRAHVDNDATQPLRRKRYTNVRLAGRFRLNDHLDLEGRFHYRDNDYNSPRFAYLRSLAEVGMSYGF